jgi:hypothetical protein
MYSPKIAEDLIPILYGIAKESHSPMTKIVDGILRDALIVRYDKIQEIDTNSFKQKEV